MPKQHRLDACVIDQIFDEKTKVIDEMIWVLDVAARTVTLTVSGMIGRDGQIAMFDKALGDVVIAAAVLEHAMRQHGHLAIWAVWLPTPHKHHRAGAGLNRRFGMGGHVFAAEPLLVLTKWTKWAKWIKQTITDKGNFCNLPGDVEWLA